MRTALAASLLLLVACSGGGAGPLDAASTPDGGPPALRDGGADAGDAPRALDAALPAEDAATPTPETLAVAHPRELRGAWIATVFNINWPKTSGRAAQQAELRELLDTAEATGLNAVFFQVRAEADAFYASELEPWSRFLTGTQGEDPGWDPLAFAVEEAHARGLELHAWLNPYRARAGRATTAASHVTNAMPESVVAYGDLRWLDPGDPAALEHTLAVVRDILRRYDVDGLHFDDYFYPYPESGVPFDDDASYAAHGGGMARDDWRRANVNRMVRRVGELVAEERPDVRFGISPFGIYRPGMPAGVVGLDQYAALYADPLAWLEGGWVDYLAPQLYWRSTSSGQSHGALIDWWADRAAESGRTLLVGNNLSGDFGRSEYETQLDLRVAARERNALGNIWWSFAPIRANTDGVRDMLAGRYAAPRATPRLVDAAEVEVAVPEVRVAADGTVEIATAPEGLRHWAVYDEGGVLARLVPAGEARLELPAGRWAISAIDRAGRESLGVIVETDGGEEPEPEPEPMGASCTHSFGGVYAHTACSPSYQCCDGSWVEGRGCGECRCVEATGEVGCE
ncbi:MAG TPA: family 10 glycosylhydrolase [Polyangiaceae bacterium LLY-WYZ-15_(1-7)]|nr:family 10 glycosylhydrolase [Polyangiaceae bacterium LLY-WYZ-15_(1-7)]HJL10154.1 family 10 glycosylhydrolase [Polyangiaceae bacterium LLY-WYZ-15_(1-7)]HJL38179.1 family 10 glycosylhydrolase [Polyangiaceae bacterium LLY-WYZ-15_(1-7)]HJL49568.1 family 10 glycosylhydrolase [Polyangiaceae bacterium LLY-WYZ-15_(1-7)]